jgi:hypothetical protein
MFAIRNPVLMLAWGLPAVAVAASVLSLIAALRTPESELPEQYHWEGFQLDRDFSQAARAAELKVHATLAGFGASRRCELALKLDGAAPETLDLFVAHATRPALDQKVTFTRREQSARSNPGAGAGTSASASASAGAGAGHSAARYVGACAPAQDAHWRLELVDKANGWALRQTVRAPLDGAALDAVAGVGE